MSNEVKTGEIVPATPTEIGEVRPDFIAKGNTGMEHLTQDDMQMPRLAVAQLTSPELDADNGAKYVPGLVFGNMFNNVSKSVYGNGPLKFCVLRADKPRWVEFTPLDQGGGVVDPNVPANDPRTLFRQDPATGKTLPPIATKFYDFVIMLMATGEVISWSLKSSGLKTARLLNSLITQRNAPMFSGVYKMTTSTTKNSKGRFAIFNVDNAGWLPDRETYAKIEELSSILRNKTIVFDQEPDHVVEDQGGDATFDTSQFEVE